MVDCLSKQLQKVADEDLCDEIGGCKPDLWLENKTKEYLQTTGSIVPTDGRVPRTIRDALLFCRKTKVRYIWMDSFCIIQDDKADQAEEIPRVFEIYSQAITTLVAISCSSSDDPLPEVSPNTRFWHQYRGTVKGLELMSCYPALVTEIEHSICLLIDNNTCVVGLVVDGRFRKLLSPKVYFFFTRTQVIFLCRQSIFCEDTVWEGSNVEAKSAKSNVPTREADDLMNIMLLDYQGRYSASDFFVVLQHLTGRRLTEDSDTLNAIFSIIQWRSNNEKENPQCLFGMPKKQFGAVLRWMPKEGHMLGPLSRRKLFPSWSWEGWKGPVVWKLHRQKNMIRVTDWGPSGIIEVTKLDKDLYKKAGQIISPVRPYSQPSHPRLPIPTETGVLQFWTSTALIPVSRTNTSDDRHNGLLNFLIMRSYDARIGVSSYHLQCDPYWRSKQLDQLEFIVIAASRLEPPDPPTFNGLSNGSYDAYRLGAAVSHRMDDKADRYEREYTYWKTHMQDRVALDLMCIQWVDGMAERVQVCQSWLLDHWLAMKPIPKLIKLK